MAQFFGSIQGMKGEETRLGSKSSGMRAEAASWQGKIVVKLSHNTDTGLDEFTVNMEPHSGKGERLEIASGVVGQKASVQFPQPA